MIIEVCANSVESALNAQKGGADRIELCGELEVGGVTPSYGVIALVREQLSIPVHVLIRPRSGNFTYTETEFEVMKRDIQFCKEIGCDGIVSGVLNADNTLDVERTKALVELSGSLSFTFHRAFDWLPNPDEAIEQLIAMGCNRILTSGQKPKAEAGLGDLVKWNEKYGNQIQLMPGSGVNAANIQTFKEKGFKEIHFSASKLKKNLTTTPKISFNNHVFDESYLRNTDLQTVQTLVNLVK
ncbi:copper homeostasis protein CutC [Galbibacter sp. EGI 63066]|uniref:copper homeostasis protein CutC n=1 Tax=Galbibacter sp. EGI 63066 TaxID=2993559 RepID=UPI00224895C8|nr:copper homeostasis protein CutC [Galbibacter sp. EGI 63066]MCX2678747.1 copper homeostasis protein CutC [Galbibacter sp. EGI 63066]